MQTCQTLLRGALLCSALGAAAWTPAIGASLSRADWERVQAATGHQPATSPHATALGFTPLSRPATYTILHSFAGGTGDGANPSAEVTLDNAGNIYGTAGYAGANESGVIFELASNGKETLLHSFGGSGDGADPDGALTLLSSGDIYGTTQGGGSGSNGILFELASGGTYTVLHSFATNEGSFIRGRLVQDKKGNFYGTALFGGVNGYGTVFKYSTKGKLTVLHAFDSTDGEYPEHGLVADKAGNLYGVTAFGGTDDEGTVYEIAKKGGFSTLYNFTGGTDGGFLYGGLAIDKLGNLYGNTVSGGANGAGTVFKLGTNGKLTTLYSFAGGADGGAPEGDMLLVGKNLYSTATTGGDKTCQCGGVYEVKASGKEKLVHAFTTADGEGYASGLTQGGATLYGTTESGGADGNGVVYSLTK